MDVKLSRDAAPFELPLSGPGLGGASAGFRVEDQGYLCLSFIHLETVSAESVVGIVKKARVVHMLYFIYFISRVAGVIKVKKYRPISVLEYRRDYRHHTFYKRLGVYPYLSNYRSPSLLTSNKGHRHLGCGKRV